MKKSLFLLLMLAVAGVTISCEREYVSDKPVTEIPSDVEASVSAVKSDIVGLWIRGYDKDTHLGNHQCEIYFRFEEDGTGYHTFDVYDEDDGRQVVMSRGGFTYEANGGELHLFWSDEEVSKMTYEVKSNLLTIYSDELEDGCSVYHKAQDADRRFIGDWHTTRTDDKYYYVDHIQFVTPTDCFMYYSKYDNPMSRPIEGPSNFVWYKYTFDDEMIYISIASNKNAVPQKKYYRFEGGKLYMCNSKDGIETCYSTIK